MPERTDREFMALALELASRGRYHTAPNPMVGAVIVKKGRIIGQGYHRRVGGDHAEVAALKNVARSVRGATIYVTLEPCCHTGHTGPCTKAIIEAGIKRVVVAVKDPNPQVNGKGLRALRKAGLTVETGLMRTEAIRLNEIYFNWHRHGRPFVVLKMAQSLDGRIATRTGSSQWISCPATLKLAHQLRAEFDGVVVGMNTVAVDNPSLTVRRVKGANPYRIVLTSSLKFPRRCHLLLDNDDYKTVVAGPAAANERFAKTKRGQNLIYWNLAEKPNGQLDVADLVKQAGSFGLRSLLIEGGQNVATEFLKLNLVDKCVIVIAPKIVGEGINAIGDLKTQVMADALQLEKHEFQQLGKDCVVIGYPRKRA
ncbi:MAG: bifunctional diaminohydroxyphosphoribosylaminopyrimidine deaminase/5-amino-6-(5-phosphoribosylamino)uracil reductase RibD [candidate division Zixibacteria bacterium]|nr:bifunctional diaminohydroxyphosphoribosylaminopyrimidine deaminase/5-amino-6-(5-phosphoribosylamino)uracil reductase RibD [candidate division Zixibacteria bacterium]